MLRRPLFVLLALALAPAAVSVSAAAAAGASTGPTTVTFTVQTGSLSITTPDSVSFGTASIGATTVSGSLGAVTVSDTRSTTLRGWIATVSSSDFITGTGTGNQDIPAANVSYIPGLATSTSGTGTFVPGLGGALGSAKTAFTGSLESGSTSASWNPTVTVTLPSNIAAGTYSGTITHSVA
ncbi:MAG TPA: hypothetical protein VGI21_08695 [Streptosporangiaceae bacterium]|jgi:hypothetical protein